MPECALPSNPPDAHMLILVVRMDFPLYTAFAQAGFAVVSPDYRYLEALSSLLTNF